MLNLTGKLKKIMSRAIDNGPVGDRYINIPRLKVFKAFFVALFIEIVFFACFYKAFYIVSACMFFIFIYFYRLGLRYWKRFYSPWPFHILAVLSIVPCYFAGALIRLLLYKIIIG